MLYISYNNDSPLSVGILEWRIGEGIPYFVRSGVIEVWADRDELTYILQRFVGLPTIRESQNPPYMVWHGGFAQFIVHNLVN